MSTNVRHLPLARVNPDEPRLRNSLRNHLGDYDLPNRDGEAQVIADLYAYSPAAAERYVTDRLAQAAQRLLDDPMSQGARENMQLALSARTELRRLNGGGGAA